MARTRLETVDLSICTDCLLYLANGEVTESNGDDITAAHAAKMAAVWGDDFDISPGSLECENCPTDDGSNCEPWFSYTQCDGCGTTLGGDRSHATAWVKTRLT
jgi:hypothetical protein